MLYGVTDLTAFIFGTIFMVLLPGPNSLYVLATASRWGIAAGYRGACGVFVGDLALMLLSVAGVASLLKAHPLLFIVIKYAGAAYLAWVGVSLVRNAITNWKHRYYIEQIAQLAEKESLESSRPHVGHPFRTALLISLMNPKSILFFISFFIQFVSPDYPYPELSFLILGSVVQICSIAYLSILILGGTHLATQFRRRRALSSVATGGAGSIFIGFSVKLASASLN